MRVGFVGWRGMVGSVLMERMRENGDFEGIEPVFFSTSNVGGRGPNVGVEISQLMDAHDLNSLMTLDILVTCQGSAFTSAVYEGLRRLGWKGYWVDAASQLRMAEESIIALDPVNKGVIQAGLSAGVRTFCGGNCTVSLMLMGLAGLFKEGLVEWVSSMTYQSASGAGARAMRELIGQMMSISETVTGQGGKLLDPASSALKLDRVIGNALTAEGFPTEAFGAPLAANVIPWIDKLVDGGQTKEEWKGFVETNKILQSSRLIPIDGQCVRVGAMRCHSQAFTIKLTQDVPLDDLQDLIEDTHSWAQVVPNNREDTLAELTPAAVSGKMHVAVGRMRKMRMGGNFLTAFSVGDQLLWGAAEPVRRMIQLIREHEGR